ncbi:methyltransferase domain-containing protein [Candidatus Bathyarchaeota archaeon]|nr:methyltransferase domain-containing protein [Candidatus Bathyarchaeota archaeon]
MSEWNKKRSIMRRYDLTAHIYDMRYAEEQTAKIRAALEAVSINKSNIVLDAGCGTGILFNHITNKTKTIIGLDISKKILLEAKKHAGQFRNVNLILADVDNMPLKERVFRNVFAFTLLQNMPNPTKTLREIERIADENATIVVTGMKKAFTLEEFERLLRNAKLKVVSLKHEGLKCYVAICIFDLLHA